MCGDWFSDIERALSTGAMDEVRQDESLYVEYLSLSNINAWL
jgi:hypothetical protein